jgi:hypothetical protein
MKLTSIVLVLFLLSGCATRVYWSRDGRTDQEFAQDSLRCQEYAGQHQLPFSCDYDCTFITCMKAIGYKEIPKP